jgi:hypothetical protein
MLKKFFSVSLAFLLIHADARGQAERARELDAQWSAIQALPAGEAIQVGLIKKGTVRGNIVSSTELTVTVATKGGEVTTARSDIKEVKVKRGQLTKNLLGAGIGGAAGVTTAAILDGALTDGNGMSGSAAVFLGAVGAGVGFLVSALRFLDKENSEVLA